MKSYKEPAKELPVIADVDVLVCGGGPAGIGAALRAAREGANTMIVESQDCLGGVATAGMMSHWGGRSSSKIMVEMWERTYQKCADSLGWCGENVGKNLTAIHHGAQKITLDEMMNEAGVKVLYYTFVCDTII